MSSNRNDIFLETMRDKAMETNTIEEREKVLSLMETFPKEADYIREEWRTRDLPQASVEKQPEHFVTGSNIPCGYNSEGELSNDCYC